MIDTNKRFVIAINRELGGGGRMVGHLLAKELGVNFYEQTFLDVIARKYSLSKDEVKLLKSNRQDLWSELKQYLLSTQENSGGSQSILKEFDQTSVDEIFEAESRIVKEIANNVSCVITSRSGFWIFRQHPNHLNVLLHSSIEHRMNLLMKEKPVSREEANELLRKLDLMRETYAQQYAGISPSDFSNYDLVLSTDEHTDEELVDIILQQF